MKVLELGKRAPIGGDKWRFYFNRGGDGRGDTRGCVRAAAEGS